jgi:hypothetical protein
MSYVLLTNDRGAALLSGGELIATKALGADLNKHGLRCKTVGYAAVLTKLETLEVDTPTPAAGEVVVREKVILMPAPVRARRTAAN